ncbi:hypothetical protein SLS58_001573 [Diplodia intermedia]|uniref:Uncharacterized protein n=1 Tax=Diplodia intermedia TaxID=856260 RepID=A0ABR3U1J0_9PEZI
MADNIKRACLRSEKIQRLVAIQTNYLAGDVMLAPVDDDSSGLSLASTPSGSITLGNPDSLNVTVLSDPNTSPPALLPEECDDPDRTRRVGHAASSPAMLPLDSAEHGHRGEGKNDDNGSDVRSSPADECNEPARADAKRQQQLDSLWRQQQELRQLKKKVEEEEEKKKKKPQQKQQLLPFGGGRLHVPSAAEWATARRLDEEQGNNDDSNPTQQHNEALRKEEEEGRLDSPSKIASQQEQQQPPQKKKQKQQQQQQQPQKSQRKNTPATYLTLRPSPWSTDEYGFPERAEEWSTDAYYSPKRAENRDRSNPASWQHMQASRNGSPADAVLPSLPSPLSSPPLPPAARSGLHGVTKKEWDERSHSLEELERMSHRQLARHAWELQSAVGDFLPDVHGSGEVMKKVEHMEKNKAVEKWLRNGRFWSGRGCGDGGKRR